MKQRRHPSVNTIPLTLILVCILGTASYADESSEGAADPHAAHRREMASDDVKRTVVNYTVPAVKLVRDDGVGVSLDKELDDGRPVVMNFIYTTCTTICPLSSQEFSMLQERLGADAGKVHLVSISIDPEQDTPQHLVEYARHFQAGKEWQHYTGTLQASIEAQRAFNVYRGDKMSHTPVTLLRGSPGASWVRLDGFVRADDLYSEVQALRAAR
jgi:protein SCO1/2